MNQRRSSNVQVKKLQDCLDQDAEEDDDDREEMEPDTIETEQTEDQGRDDPLNKSGRLSLKEELSELKGEFQDDEDLENFDKLDPQNENEENELEEGHDTQNSEQVTETH